MRTKILIFFFAVAQLVQPSASAGSERREWEPIRPRDYWIDAALAAGAFAAYTQIEQQSGRWGDANPVDDAGRSALRFSSAGQRADAHQWSNVALAGAIAVPMALDPALTWSRGGHPRSAARVWNINAQAFGLTAILTGTTKALVGRERPYARECRRNPASDPGCASLDREEGLKSFYSGHSVYAFTGAGLACLHHSELNLFGDSRDAWACGGAIGLAAAVALLRVGADKHYLSDVSTGAVIGLLSGYVFPKWLHKPRDAGVAQSYWLPMVGAADTYGLVRTVHF